MSHDPAASRRPQLALLVTVALLAIVGVLAGLAPQAPAAKSAQAPADEFSAARAERHLESIAAKPHPPGSAEHTRVRGYIAQAAERAGAEVEIDSGEVVQPDMGSPFAAATVHNVVATLPGNSRATGPGSALLLVAHYDSAPGSPGASDNGAAVAAGLETLRALKASGGVDRDVVFLFSDAEEIGALGAQRFVDAHDMDRYAAVLNWEARGSSGPVMMFETSPGNRPLIEALADSGTRTVANSLAYEVYKHLPNDSDFAVFREAGMAGFNSAYLKGFHEYHSPFDTVERTDLDSVQHHGEAMLGMVRALDSGDPSALDDSGDAVYFDLFARVLVHYPAFLAVPLAGLTVLALGVLLVLGVRRGALRPARVALAAGAGLGAVLLAGALTYGLWLLASLLSPGLAALPLSEPYTRNWFAAAFGAVVAAVLLLLVRQLRGARPAETGGGVLALLGTLLVAVVVLVPGASYLLQWPLLAGLPALWWACFRPGRTEAPDEVAYEDGSLGGLALRACAPLVALVLFVPLADSLLVALGVPLGAVAVAVATLGGVLAVPLLARLPRPGLLAAVAGVSAVALLATGLIRHDFTPDRPRPNSLLYVQDLEKDRAMWLSPDPEPDAWTEKALGDDPETASAKDYYPPRGDTPVMVAKAPDQRIPAPTVRLVKDRTTAQTRTVRFRAESQRSAWRIQIRLPRAELKACTIAGTRLDRAALREQTGGADDVVFHYYGERRAELSCDVPAGTTLPVDVADYTIGLTPQVQKLVGPRPSDTAPVSFGFAPEDSVIARQIEEI